MEKHMPDSRATLYTEGHRVEGTVVTGRERFSDLLNNPHTSVLELHDAILQELLTDREPQPARLRTILKSQVILAMTTGGVDVGVASRVPTKPIRVELVCPLYTLEGDLLHRSSDPTNLALVFGGFNRVFVPITRVSIRYLPNARFDTEAPVVLVNSRHLQIWTSEPAE